MSDTFTASNGVVLDAFGGWVTDNCTTVSTTAQDHEARKEFYLHERDKALGRWRWRENPDYVVYPKKPSVVEPVPGVRVVYEKTGRSRDVGRESMGACDGTVSQFWQAARAYFAAHPEPKPWHDAKPGEMWVITTENVAYEVAVQVTHKGTFQYNDGYDWPISELPIVTARRIWPEVTP